MSLQCWINVYRNEHGNQFYGNPHTVLAGAQYAAENASRVPIMELIYRVHVTIKENANVQSKAHRID